MPAGLRVADRDDADIRVPGYSPSGRAMLPEAHHHDSQETRVTLDYGRFEALTFDCYGTLIDWETGLAGRVPADPPGPCRARRRRGGPRPLRRSRGRRRSRPVPSLPGCPGRRVAWRGRRPRLRAERRRGRALLWVRRRLAGVPGLGRGPGARCRNAFRLGVITNCDDDLFAASNARLGVTFDWIVTAQQVGSYKPSDANFHAAFERLGLPRDRILHVAQSLFHDHVPGEAAGPLQGLDRSPSRSPGRRGDTAGGGCRARCDIPGHGLVRGGRHGVIRGRRSFSTRRCAAGTRPSGRV